MYCSLLGSWGVASGLQALDSVGAYPASLYVVKKYMPCIRRLWPLASDLWALDSVGAYPESPHVVIRMSYIHKLVCSIQCYSGRETYLVQWLQLRITSNQEEEKNTGL